MLGPRKIRLVADLPLSDHFRRERALNLRLEHPDQIVGGDRADQLEDDAAVAADDESLGHPIYAPFDGRAPVSVQAIGGGRAAVKAEKAPGVVSLSRSHGCAGRPRAP